MKLKLISLLLLIVLSVAGCSSSTQSNTPEDKLDTINTMMSKGYEMTDNQRYSINKGVEEAQKLLAANKTDEANRLLNQTINMLELIEETDRFNKSE